MLRRTDIEAILRDFGRQTGAGREDPVIHFYELFLKEYDPKEKLRRGVFYTPRPVVSFIVRSVDELLRTEFGLEDGLADTTTWGEITERHERLYIPEGASANQAFVQVLDPATGTGTFLVEVIAVIHKTMMKKWRAEGRLELEIPNLWNEYVPKHLLPRLYGYELLMAPYAIAHMKIGLKLYETGYHFGSDERARIYLTNSLEPAQDFSDRLAFAIPALAHEAEAVNAVKRDQRFTVVIGNPPYSVYSSNSGPHIHALMETYKQIEGDQIDEVRIAPLMDDYCKFLRYSDYLIKKSWCGVIGMITNHSYLTGPVFRGMRFNLAKCYSVEVLDLHGNYFRGDPMRGDVNVFEIRPGVCISMLVLGPERKTTTHVHYDELRGSAEEKFSALLRNRGRLGGSKVLPQKPYYIWTPQSEEGKEYLTFHRLDQVFEVGTLGMMTGKDHFMIDFSIEVMRTRIHELIDQSIPSQQIRVKYDLKDSRDWVLDKARTIVFDEADLAETCYRPFDKRYTYYDKKALASAQLRVNKLLRERGNIALCVPRQLASLPFRHCIVSDCVTEMSFVSNRTKEATRVFPLYLVGRHIN